MEQSQIKKPPEFSGGDKKKRFSISLAGGGDGLPGGAVPLSGTAYVADVRVFLDEPGVTVGEDHPCGLAVAVSEDIDLLTVVGMVGAAVIGEAASGAVSHIDQMSGLFYLYEAHRAIAACCGQIEVVAH